MSVPAVYAINVQLIIASKTQSRVLEKKMPIIMILLIFNLLTATAFAAPVQPPLLLESVSQQVSEVFASLDKTMQQAAAELGKTGLKGDAARQTLARICKGYSATVDCCSVDLKGRMLTVEPASYRSFEGKDISGQKQVVKVLGSRKPVLSQVFRSVEGYDAVDLEYPVFTPAGEFIGSVSILLKPEKILGEIIKPLLKGLPGAVWSMDTEGRILYDADSRQIGLNLFTAELYRPYTSLITLGRQVAKTEQGSGSYLFTEQISGRVVNKQAFWKTVSLYDANWRLVLIHQESGNQAALPVVTKSVEDGLKSMAAEKNLQMAFASGNKSLLLKEFQYFYEKNPGIYSVQWVDAKGISRFGYPLENSLADYDFHSNKAPSDGETLAILKKREPSGLEAPLFEERSGIFRFQPVFNGSQYLGMIYSITLKQK